MLTRSISLSALILACLSLSSCDFFRKRKCEWYLIADKSQAAIAKPGYATVCIRNYELNRQRCSLVIKLSEAENVFSKKFRLSDMEIDDDKFPKEISKIKACEP